jgi:acetyl esterase/lipase
MPWLRPAFLLTWLLGGCSGAELLNAVAPSAEIVVTTDVAYGQGPRRKLDIYRPIPANAPVVLFIYGGSWKSGDRSMYRFVGGAFASRGFVTVVPDYRVYPEVKYPAFIDDAAAAVAWIKANIANYGGNPRRIFLVGHSAGGHIAAMLTLDKAFLADVGMDPDRDIAGMIGLSGPYDFLPLHDPVLETIFAPAGDLTKTQPIAFARSGAPPMLLLTGESDTTVYPRNSRQLAEAIQKRGGRASLKVYPGLSHVMIAAAFSRLLSWKAPILDDCVAFMQTGGV